MTTKKSPIKLPGIPTKREPLLLLLVMVMLVVDDANKKGNKEARMSWLRGRGDCLMKIALA